MIHLKMLFHKNIRKYGIILFTLFSLVLLLVNFSLCINYQINEKQTSEVYRMLSFTPKENFNVNSSIEKYKEFIEEYDMDLETNEGYIKFSEIKYLENYLNEYQDDFEEIRVASFSLDSRYTALKTTTKILIFFTISIVLVLIFVFSINIIYNLEKDVSLYKLLGFSNHYIMSLILGIIYLYYLLIYLLSIAFSNIVLYFLKLYNLNKFIGINNFNLLTLDKYFIIGIILSIATILSFIRIGSKIKKNTPINLIKSN